MSKYTTEVRFICETNAGLVDSVGYNSINEIIQKARPYIFDFSYPIFDETYRSVLETKILKHFYTREIGAESVGLWKLWLNTRLNEIMPYYNKLYESELIEFNPMYDVDLTTDHVRNINGNDEFTENNNISHSGGNSSETDAEGREQGGAKINRWEYYSDTPQGGIDGLESLTYLTNARHTTDDGSESIINRNNHSYTHNNFDDTENGKRTGNNKMNNIEDYLEHVKGKTAGASYSKKLIEFRQTFINIDMQVINELNDLFMNLW